jgi:hypothetical protein
VLVDSMFIHVTEGYFLVISVVQILDLLANVISKWLFVYPFCKFRIHVFFTVRTCSLVQFQRLLKISVVP